MMDLPRGSLLYSDLQAITCSMNGRSQELTIDEKSGQIRRKGGVARFFGSLWPLSEASRQAHNQRIKSAIQACFDELSALPREAFIDPQSQECQDLFLAIQRYNQAIIGSKDKLASELGLVPFKREGITGLAGLEIARVESWDLGVSADQRPLVHHEGYFTQHRVYHYNAADRHIHHGHEALRIFFSTQKERLLSLIGRVVQWVAAFFHRRIAYFQKYHYFLHEEDKRGEIYARDAPIVQGPQKASSYWVGHATCCLQLNKTSRLGKKVRLNLITDPVEGDLHKIFYPRMTKPSRPVEDCPASHIYLLSHNHLDHYSRSTICKLLALQPVMIVPEGDGEKFRKLGFKNIYEHNWWQSTNVTFSMEDGDLVDITVTAVPAHHWSGQGPCDGHRAAFLGYVIHEEAGDIYFAGDTARLSEAHIDTLRERFNIRVSYQPGGPDEVRGLMESTHQASVDALWMHFHLMVRKLYESENSKTMSKGEFMAQAASLQTLFMHTKAYKLGNLHFDDTDRSVAAVVGALRGEVDLQTLKSYERQVHDELLDIGQELCFQDGHLDGHDIAALIDASVLLPKIGQRTRLTALETPFTFSARASGVA